MIILWPILTNSLFQECKVVETQNPESKEHCTVHAEHDKANSIDGWHNSHKNDWEGGKLNNNVESWNDTDNAEIWRGKLSDS